MPPSSVRGAAERPGRRPPRRPLHRLETGILTALRQPDEVVIDRTAVIERQVAVLRLVGLGVVSLTLPLLEPEHVIAGLAWPLVGLYWAYALFIHFRQPFAPAARQKLGVYASFIEILITLAAIYATGSFESPYYVSLYVMIGACGFRHAPWPTLAVTFVCVAGYYVVLGLAGDLGEHTGAIAVRGAHAFLIAVLTGAMSHDALKQVASAVQLRERVRASDQLRRSEALLAEAQTIAHLGSYEWEPGSRSVTCSAEMLRIMGILATHAVVPVKSLYAALAPEDRAGLRQAIADSRARTGRFEHEARVVWTDGTVRWVTFHGAWSLDPATRLARLVGTAQDVTERKELQARLLLSDRLASMGTLASGVAHEINNPLAYVIGNLDCLGQALGELRPGDPTDELTEMLEDARDGARRVASIVRDLKAFSRADEDAREAVDLAHAIELAVRLSGNQLRHRARLVRDEEPLPPALGNESRLVQVFINLLVNAAQALPEGEAERHEVRVTARRDGAGHAVVSVTDTGCGIPPAQLAQVWNPFFTTKAIGVGTGLGLSICHGIVKAMGGTITVTSQVGRGTTFSVRLPLAQGVAFNPRTTTPPVTTAPAGPPARLLIVDDEASIGATLGRMLGREYAIECVTSAREALARVTAGERWDVILSDLMMPDMTGMDFYDALAATPELRPRCVFMTGGVFTERAQAFLTESGRPTLDKPFDPARLRRVLAQVASEGRQPPPLPAPA